MSVACALSALNALDPGCDRESWVIIGMAAKAAGLSLEDFTNWSSRAPNFDGERDCAQVWGAFKDGPVKAGTLFKMAIDAGWQDPEKSRQNSPESHQIDASGPTPNPSRQPLQKPAKSARNLWDRCEPATAGHPYIKAKNGRPDGLRVVPAGESLTIAGQSIAGCLAVPAFSMDSTLRTLQLIPPQGKKLNLPGCSFEDGFFVVGGIEQSSRVFVGEGLGQAWACHRATGCAAVVCFGAGRLVTVTEVLRREYPGKRIVVVPDRCKENQAAQIAKDCRAEWIELPDEKLANYDVADFAAEYSDDALAVLLEQSRKPPMRYQLLQAADLADGPPLGWLVRGVLPNMGIAALYGPSASGKSFLALDLSAAIAAGADWFDCRVEQAPVTYCALEGEAGFAQRVKAWQMLHGHDLPDALRFILQPLDLRKAVDLAELAEAVTVSGGAGGLLVIDTLNRAASGADENSSQDMGLIIGAAKALQSRLGGLVLLVHHTGKDVARGLRGHSSLYAALDAAIEVRRDGDRREWGIAKAKDGSDNAAHPFRLEVVEVGAYDDGESITSCAVMPYDGPREVGRAKLPQGGNQRIAHNVLGEPLRQSRDFGKAGAPAARPCLELETAVAIVAHHLTCNLKHRTERAREAITGLVAKQIYSAKDGWLWMN